MVTFDGQLARLDGGGRERGLSEPDAGLLWLQAHRPDAPRQLAICHGDFHPLNIMADARHA